MKKHLLTAAVVISAITAKTQVIPNVDWVKTYSERNQISNSPSAIDANGNVYVTGYTYPVAGNQDATTIKYDALGNLQWVKNYDNGGADNAKAIVLDASGNVIVTGESAGATSANDIFVIKYDGNTGAVLWTKRYNGAANGNESANAITVDNAGNIYITGYTTNANGYRDYITLKYDSNGNSGFISTYAGIANANNEAISIAVNNNRLYISGTANNINNTTASIVTIRLNPNNGNVVWTKAENGTTVNGYNVNYALMAYNNDVIMVGMVNNTSTGNDYITSYYNGNNGTTAWRKTYDNNTGFEYATSLTKDATGNIVVTGISSNTQKFEYHTIMYNASGVQQWLNKEKTNLVSPNALPQITVDPIFNHFYVCGERLGTLSDILVYQITPTGNSTWSETYGGVQGGNDAAVDLVVNAQGVIYVAGASLNNNAKFDYTTIRISQTPVYFPIDLGAQEIRDKNFLFQRNEGQLLNTNLQSVSKTDVEYFFAGKSPAIYVNANKYSSLLSSFDTSFITTDTTCRVDFSFVKSNTLTKLYAFDEVDSKSNYFVGNTNNGITDVSSFERLVVPNAYPNVDVHYYSNTSGLKMALAFKTISALNTPVIRIDGAISTLINSNGELIAKTLLGDINYGKLKAYQLNALLQPVSISGTATWQNITGNDYKLNVTGLNVSLPLIVIIGKSGSTTTSANSPINNLYWSTFLGNVGNETIYNSTIDAKDNYYVVGSTASLNFPVLNGAYFSGANNLAGINYGILAKFDKDGKPDYGTYYGGKVGGLCNANVDTRILDVAVDSLYNIYIVGRTFCTDIISVPVSVPNGFNDATNDAQTVNNSNSNCINAVFAKFNSLGNVLRHSTYFGGTKWEDFQTIKYQNGQLAIAGASKSSSVNLSPLSPGKYQATTGDGIYVHLDTTGALIHSTKMTDEIKDLAYDKNDNVYLIGTTYNFGLPQIQPAPSYYISGKSAFNDWTIQRMTAADGLTWSTYFGGNGGDNATAVYIRDSVMAIVGYGTSTVFPYYKAPSDSGDVAPNFSDDIQLAKFNINTGSRLWVAYHATFNLEKANDVVLDKNFNMYVTGEMTCPNGSPINCVSTSFRFLQAPNFYFQNNRIDYDGFLLTYSAANKRKWTTIFGTTQVCTTCQGGGAYDVSKTLAINSKNQLFMGGNTANRNNKFPLSKWNNVCFYDTTSADPYPSNNADMFVSMFDVSNFNIIGIEEHTASLSNNTNVSLYPNPNDGSFNLHFKKPTTELSDIQVTTILGQVIYTEAKVNMMEDYNIALKELKQGIYFLTLTTKMETTSIKFIVK
jgi:hypothetical protein